MKRIILIGAVLMLILALVVGCGKTQTEQKPTDPNEPTDERDPAQDEGNGENEGDDPYIDVAYAQQINRYYTAISQKWDEGTCIDNGLSGQLAYYYEGNPLDNVGFALKDLDGDDVFELIIGAIKDAQNDPQVFEIWTLKDGNPVMLVQSGSRNRYYLQYSEDDGLWSVAYEAENGAANHAVYYLQLCDGEFQVTQGVIFDAVADKNNPWFLTYDLDWDVSNDESTDEELANAIISAGRRLYTSIEYTPYTQYK